MKIITRQSLANEAAARWTTQYRGSARYPTDPDKLAIAGQLAALPAPVDPNEVERIIGNTSWTTPPACNVCGDRKPTVIEVGEEPDYESRTAYLCLECVRTMAALANSVKE